MPRPADEEDFTSAAESLLGIDLSSSRVPSEPIDLDDSDLFGAPDVIETPQVPAAAPPVAAAPSSPLSIDDDDDFGRDFGSGLDTGNDDLPSPVAESAPTAPPTPPRKDDSYWDALEGFDWGDDTGSQQPKSPAREERPRSGGGRSSDRSRSRSSGTERSGDRPSRRPSDSMSSPPPARQRPPRPVADSVHDDFGSGLDEEPTPPRQSSAPDPDVSTFPLHPSESQARFVRRDQDVGPPPDVSAFPLNPTESQARYVDRGREQRPARPSRPATPPPPPPPAPVVDEDDFGAGIDEPVPSSRGDEPDTNRSESSGSAASEPEQRRGRRRRGRGRGGDRPRADEARTPVESRVPEPEPLVEDAFDDSFDEPSGVESVSVESDPLETRFADVPTWSEAIALLVKGRPRTTENGGGRGRSETSSGSTERTGGDRGRGRGGRRGGGGRRRSQ